MKRSRSSNAWLREHMSDSYVRRAQIEGYRSRAAYKLAEIDDRDHLIRPGSLIIDLGAAPGGWSQLASERLKGHGRIIAVDLLDMPPLPEVLFVRGDFADPGVLRQIETLLAGQRVDLVLSDMSPNISGIAIRDQALAADLAARALDFARRWLKPDGALLVKVFQGCEFAKLLTEMRKGFGAVLTRKPGASRDRSAELYLLGRMPKS
ncbi:RlmE family RNA methyltransferase [Accumulibacter sp.]|uniref:RlmE family RNA methyltransferase n=1 Tax=Accumulibacter sp. TaxID=2053492 RepID=UPI0025CCB297|nr:RlmE family RNA methyltransferase [Accumulibacter sp.]MCM8593775.1 RlmE family RNA methyltransferase [Accumulibacter sp.]MCM8627689.1 RlmE family RNA methyltransferase [Accumulibacter sp.]MDS4047915.1 RlmE family RNA methyltransferase [Accumulibacter sp.]